MKRLFQLFLLIGISVDSFGLTKHYVYDFIVDNVYYAIMDDDPTTVKVTYDYYTIPTSGDREYYCELYSGNIKIPKEVTYNGTTYKVVRIGGYAFYGNTNIVSVDIPEGVTHLGNYAFANCSNLAVVKSPKSVTTIGNCTFHNCTKLAAIDLYEGLQSIGEYAFGVCKALTSIEIPSTTTSIGAHAFYSCENLISMEIPEGVESVGEYAFYYCSNLTSLKLPSTLTSLSSYIVDNTDVTSLEIPAGIESLEHGSTIGCTSLYFYSTTPPSLHINSTKQSAVYSSQTIHVPVGYKDIYANSTNGWSTDPDLNIVDDIVLTNTQSMTFADGTDYTNSSNQIYSNLSYTRTFSSDAANVWNALYIPISFDVAAHLDKFDVAEIFAVCPYKDTNNDGVIDASDENYLVVNKKSSGVTSPNQPYLIRPKSAGNYTITSADNILYKAETNKIVCSTSTDTYTFTGLNTSTSVSGSTTYYVAYDGTLDSSPSTPVTIKANRWIMDIEHNKYGSASYSSSSSAKRMNILVIGDDIDISTAIQMQKANISEDTSVYTIDGRKVADNGSLSRGVYIKNGKKFIVK